MKASIGEKTEEKLNGEREKGALLLPLTAGTFRGNTTPIRARP